MSNRHVWLIIDILWSSEQWTVILIIKIMYFWIMDMITNKIVEFGRIPIHLRFYNIKCKLKNILNYFLAKALKKPTEYFLKFLFYLKVLIYWLITKHNFIQMAVSPGYAVAYTIGPIFKHIVHLCSCIWPMDSRILSLTASIVSGLWA